MFAWALLLTCAACGPNPAEPTTPAGPRVIPVLTPLLVQDSACTRVTITFVGSKNIEVTFPDRTTCSSGVALIPGGTPTRNGSGSRNANIPIRLLNRSGFTLQGPARVVLSPADRVILDPAGGDPNKLTPQNHDSVRAESGAWVWLAGGPGTVPVDDSSAVTTLVVRLASPAGSAQMSFTVDVGQLSPGGWPLLTDLPSLDTTKTVTLPGGNIEYFRTSAGLIFKSGVSDLAKQQFFGQHGLSVIGVTKSGKFFVSFPDPGTTAESLLSFFDFLEAQPEVLLVMHLSRSGMDESISARFPTDGSSRAAWFSQANPLWAMRAIRAPQAWGCETGSYAGSPLVHVGLLEWVHSPQHPELAASFSSLWVPEDDSDMKAASKLQRSAVRRNQLETHGAETAGLLTASGDDNRGIAGTAWRTQLSMYGLLSNERRPLPDNGFYKVIEGILEGGAPRILSVSGGYVDSSSSPAPRRRSIGWLESDLRDLMIRAPDLLLVVAAGNERRHVTPAAYESTDSVDVLRAAILRLRVDSLYSERIIVVAGTEPGNEFWATNANEPTEGSNSFAGATDIGAPAHAVMVMDAAPGGVVGIRPAWGTSLSAPMVAGAAALLLAMDPSLTAADVKRYLIRGSQAARYDSTTGMLVNPVPVKNVPNATFHQLDVYGALSLLSKERQGLPICGYPVTSRNRIDGHVILEKNGPTQPATDSIKVPGAGWAIGRVSVAPGGRIIAARSITDSGNGGSASLVFFNLRGERLGHKTGAYRTRRYLEAHYVDHREFTDPLPFQEFTRFTSQGVPNGSIPALKYPDGTLVRLPSAAGDWIDVSPDGRFVAFSAGGVSSIGTFVQRFSDNTTTRIGDMGNVRWTKDGTQLLVFRSDTTGNQSFQFYQVDSTAHGGFQPGEQFSASGRSLSDAGSAFSGDDAVLFTAEWSQQSGAFLAIRPRKALGTIAAEASSDAWAFRAVGNLIGRIP